MPIAMYPGSFDPVTNGHLDIIKRASRMFDKVIVAVLINSAKHPLFTVEERVELLKKCCASMPNVEVKSFDGLTVHFAKANNAAVMVRGLRAVTDFENVPGHFHPLELPVQHRRQGGCPLRGGHLQVRGALRRRGAAGKSRARRSLSAHDQGPRRASGLR